jgi:transcriptional regulator with XRE-family HTH domain
VAQAKSLKDWRESAGLTQQQVAHGIGVHVQYVSDIERGKRRPGTRVALRIRDFTDGAVTLDAQFPVSKQAA